MRQLFSDLKLHEIIEKSHDKQNKTAGCVLTLTEGLTCPDKFTRTSFYEDSM